MLEIHTNERRQERIMGAPATKIEKRKSDGTKIVYPAKPGKAQDLAALRKRVMQMTKDARAVLAK